MSFGWSAGDIAQAIGLVIKVVKALDNTNGAAAEYREAVAFLRRLKHTLEPLQTFSALNLYSQYGDDIRQSVEKIKGPIEKFLSIAKNFESSLSTRAKSGFQHNMGRKVQWSFYTSKRVGGLRKEIENELKILDTLLHRLTLEMVVAVHKNLNGELRTAFTNVLDPRLIVLLQENLQPIQQELSASQRTSDNKYETLLSKFQQQNMSLDLAVEAIKLHITNATQTLKTELSYSSTTLISYLEKAASVPDENLTASSESLELMKIASTNPKLKGSLQDIYYVVFLYLGQFLRDLFLALSQMVKIVPPPTRRLLVKYNISFYDALRPPPRVLDYECFVSYKVFRAFLEDSFSARPGSSWVEMGLYQLASARNGSRITPESWSKMISPGSHVKMSMLINHFLASKLKTSKAISPSPDCSGLLQKQDFFDTRLKKCSKCDLEVVMPDALGSSSNSRAMEPPMKPFLGGNNNSKLTQFDTTVERFEGNLSSNLEDSRKRSRAGLEQSAINDMVHFKRVALGPGLSFLFTVNKLPLNEEANDGGVPPRIDTYGRWLPPVYSAGFGPQSPGRIYRWTNDAAVKVAADCHYHDGQWLSKNAAPLAVYRKATMFYCNPFDQFLISNGDASTRDMATAPFPDNRWYPLTFINEGTLSRVDVAGEGLYLAVSGSATGSLWVHDLGLLSYANQTESSSTSGGLGGNLAIIIALVAFSCRTTHFDDILRDRAWHRHAWLGHSRASGRRSRRGVVVSIYLDPENPQDSTGGIDGTLSAAEWEEDALLR